MKEIWGIIAAVAIASFPYPIVKGQVADMEVPDLQECGPGLKWVDNGASVEAANEGTKFDGDCEYCDVGEWSDSFSAECTACPDVTWTTPEKGATSDDECNVPVGLDCTFDDSEDCRWTYDNSENTEFQWTKTSGSTSSSPTGPDDGHGDSSPDNYIYIESTGRTADDKAWFMTYSLKPKRTGRCLKFWYHMKGADIGELKVLLKNDEATDNPVELWKRMGEASNANIWHEGYVNFASDKKHSIIFEGVVGGELGDIALDDIKIIDQPCGCNFDDWSDSANPIECSRWQNAVDDDFDWYKGTEKSPCNSAARRKKRSRDIHFHDDGNGYDTSYSSYKLVYDLGNGKHFMDWEPSCGNHQGFAPVHFNSDDEVLDFFEFYTKKFQEGNLISVYTGDKTLIAHIASLTVANIDNSNGDKCVITSAYDPDDGVAGPVENFITLKSVNCETNSPEGILCERPYNYVCDSGPQHNDHTSGSNSGGFLYIDGVGFEEKLDRAGKTAELRSDIITIHRHRCLNFFWNMFGSTVNKLEVYLIYEDSSAPLLLWKALGDYTNPNRYDKFHDHEAPDVNSQGRYFSWFHAYVHIPRQSKDFRISISGTVDGVDQGDITIDDLVLLDGGCEHCPDGYFYFPDDSRPLRGHCYKDVPDDPQTHEHSDTQCKAENHPMSHSIHVESYKENWLVEDHAIQADGIKKYWIGLKMNSEESGETSGTWKDETTFDCTNDYHDLEQCGQVGRRKRSVSDPEENLETLVRVKRETANSCVRLGVEDSSIRTFPFWAIDTCDKNLPYMCKHPVSRKDAYYTLDCSFTRSPCGYIIDSGKDPNVINPFGGSCPFNSDSQNYGDSCARCTSGGIDCGVTHMHRCVQSDCLSAYVSWTLGSNTEQGLTMTLASEDGGTVPTSTLCIYSYQQPNTSPNGITIRVWFELDVAHTLTMNYKGESTADKSDLPESYNLIDACENTDSDVFDGYHDFFVRSPDEEFIIELCVSGDGGSSKLKRIEVVGEIACPPGSYAEESSNGIAYTCEKCPDGQYRAGIGKYNDACEECWDDSVSNQFKSWCVCNAGYENSTEKMCTICADDYYKWDIDNIACIPCWDNMTNTHLIGDPPDRSHCDCVQGYDKHGGALCTPCIENYYKTETTNNTGCDPCLEAKITVDPGADNPDLCVCRLGEEPKENGECAECEGNEYKSVTGNEECEECWASSTPSTNRETCECNAGYEPTEDNDGEMCSECPEGSFKATKGNVACDPCPEGETTDGTGKTVCVCKAGYGGTTGSCQKCLKGQYKADAGDATCTACTNPLTTLGIGSLLCDACAVGYEWNTGPTCTACGEGFYKDVADASSCRDCGLGRFTIGTAPTQCYCAKGYGFINQGCQQCALDMYKDTVADSPCQYCINIIGKNWDVTTEKGASEQHHCTCKEGYQRQDENSPCTKCPEDWFKDSKGDGPCEQCKDNQITEDLGSTSNDACICIAGYQPRGEECEQCPKGKYKADDGDTACDDCDPVTETTAGLGTLNKDNCICIKGYERVTTGADCTQCNYGYYKTNDGNGPCAPCDATTEYTEEKGSTLQEECVCKAGYYRQEDPNTCMECHLGFYKVGIGNEGCDPCGGDETTVDPGADDNSYCVCKPGFQRIGAECVMCAFGYYKDEPGDTLCKKCPEGKFTTIEGATNPSTDCVCNAGYGNTSPDCEKCPLGEAKPTVDNALCATCSNNGYTLQEGSTVCDACKLGYGYYEEECVACGLGKYNPMQDDSPCWDCPAGTNSTGTANEVCDCAPGFGLDSGKCMACEVDFYKEGINNMTCSRCPNNRITEYKASGDESLCTCPEGQFLEANGMCVDCAKGTFKFGYGDGPCVRCESSESTLIEGESDSAQCLCRAGYYRNDQTCEECPIGTHKNGTGNGDCDSCVADIETTVVIGSTQPEQCVCIKGYERASAEASCSPCGKGFYKALDSNEDCNPCNSETETTFNTGSTLPTDCVCQPGRYRNEHGNCVKCDQGTFKEEEGDSQDLCLDCGDDETTMTNGADDDQQCVCKSGFERIGDECVKCKKGFHKALAGETLCAACTGNTTTTHTGETDMNNCVCKPGFGFDQQNNCNPCARGTYKLLADNDVCDLCPRPMWTDTEGSTACDGCVVGYGYVNGQCLACGIGTYSPSADGGSCITCPDGMHNEDSENAYCECDKGYGMTNGECLKCDFNWYSSKISNDSCSQCPTTTITTAKGADNLGNCTCDVGKYMVNGACVDCNPGTFKFTKGDGPCTSCDGDSSTLQAGSDQGFDCVCIEGYWRNNADCMKCPKGTYKPIKSNEDCTACPENSTTTETGSTNITDCVCKPGYELQGEKCMGCAVGTFKEEEEDTQCTDCVGARTTAGEKSTDQNECVCIAGYYENPDGVCVQCERGTHKLNIGNGACDLCDQKESTDAKGKTLEEDCKCKPGYERIGVECTLCPKREYSTDVSDNLCLECEFGKTTSGEGSTLVTDCVCAPGFEYNADSDTCTECPIGYYKETLGNDDCTRCGDGEITLQIGADSVQNCVCIKGYSRMFEAQSGAAVTVGRKGVECFECSYSHYSDTFEQEQCTACPDGKLTVTRGNTDITDCLCPSGQFAYSDGNVCELCPESHYKAAEGNGLCTACSTLQYTSVTGSTSSAACSPVPAASLVEEFVRTITLEDEYQAAYRDRNHADTHAIVSKAQRVLEELFGDYPFLQFILQDISPGSTVMTFLLRFNRNNVLDENQVDNILQNSAGSFSDEGLTLKTSEESDDVTLYIIIGCVVGGILLLALLIVLCYVCCRNRRRYPYVVENPYPEPQPVGIWRNDNIGTLRKENLGTLRRDPLLDRKTTGKRWFPKIRRWSGVDSLRLPGASTPAYRAYGGGRIGRLYNK